MQVFTPSYWRQSAAELKDIRKLVFSALMIAAYVMLSSVFIPLDGTGTLRIMTRFLPQVLIGAVCGPLMGFIAGFAADWLGTVLIPTGAPVFGLFITAAVRGFLYGLFLYRKPIAVSLGATAAQVIARFTVCQFLVNALCHVGLNSLWFTLERTEGIFWPAFLANAVTRTATNLLQWPFQVLLMVALCKALWPSIREYGLGIRPYGEISGDNGREMKHVDDNLS